MKVGANKTGKNNTIIATGVVTAQQKLEECIVGLICKISGHKWDGCKWKHLPGCRQKCTVCGVEAYDHKYKVISEHSGRDIDYTYETCSVCGHSGFSAKLKIGYIETGMNGQE